MVGKSKVVIEEHMTLPEILSEIKKRKIEYELTERLIFISDLFKGFSVPTASKNIGVSHTAGYDWLERWNKEGLDGLIPKYGGGRPSGLSKEDLERLDKILLKTPNLTNDNVFDIIKYEFGIEYSDRHISRILRKLNYTYTKPYMIYKKMPEDAEEQLKKNF
ncbi:MAG: transposase [Methanobrevibacter sp.]|jgi:putative transposase|nr:transposase [Candidatus Methanoflexus mossambicus]